MDNRKIIFESYVGSHLYGTNRPDSDEDYQGVFMPSRIDLLGIGTCPQEWSLSKKLSEGKQNTAGDIDRKFYSLKRFFNLAAEGQPGQLELFFVPKDKVISYDPIWSEILDNLSIFLSRKNIAPFVGFALAQAHKATIKGENLNLIRNLISWYKSNNPTGEIKDNVIISGTGPTINEFRCKFPNGSELKGITNKHGFTTVEICGRNYDIGLKVKTFINNLKEIERKFGKRSQAAAENKYDYKSLMHAYRLLEEAEELLKVGKISFPRPPEELSFLISVREGTCGDIDHWAELTNRIDRLRQEVEPNSFLPKESNYAKINELCVDLLSRSLK